MAWCYIGRQIHSIFSAHSVGYCAHIVRMAYLVLYRWI